MKELINELVECKKHTWERLINTKQVKMNGKHYEIDNTDLYERGIKRLIKRHKMYCKAIRILKAHERGKDG